MPSPPSRLKKRDAKDRHERIVRAREKLENLDLNRGRGPKTEQALQKRVDLILLHIKVQNWLRVEIGTGRKEVFYPGDWFKDPALRSVSLAARGLWIDMLCLMFEGDHRGYLPHATGKPVQLDGGGFWVAHK